jgi:Transport and Golgi organisation 2
MCVLTYLPLAEDGFVITNNRDEHIKRAPSILPQKYIVGHATAYFPKDPVAGGTWLATNGRYTLCLLNGAFEKHVSKPPYTKSRGQIILDFFKNTKSVDSIDINYLKDFENFTLIIIDSKQKSIEKLVWDGSQKYIDQLDWNMPYMWSSCTLYSKEIVQRREVLFKKFIDKTINPKPQELFNFHKFGDIGDTNNNLFMKRDDGLCTQSISQIENIQKVVRFRYLDTLTAKEVSIVIL